MALRSVRASTMMVAVLLAATAAAPPAKEGEDDDFYASFTGFEDRVFNLEKSWKKLDQQLQKGAENMDLLHKKLDRLERLMSNRAEGNNEKLESRALHAQNAAERAASACNRLHHKLHTNSFNMQNTQTTNQGIREPSRVHHQSRDLTQQWPDHQKEKKDGGHVGEKRPIVMQQDATFSKEAFTISAKITNMYNELWRRSIIQEGLTKDSMALMNVTRKDTQDSLRSMMQLMRRSCSSITQPVQQCNVDQVIKMNGAMQHKLNDIDHKMYAKLDEVVMKQDSSRTAQDKELSELEDAIVNVLDRLSGAVLNKTSVIFNALQNIQELVKSHNSHVVTGITKINDAVHASNKDLTKSIGLIGDDCRTQQDDNNKNKELTEKLENVVMLLQMVQQQMTYSEEHEIEETNTVNKDTNEHLQEEPEIDNGKILESISLLCKNRTSEVNHVIEKLSHLIDKVQKSVTQLEERDDFFENDSFDKENKEEDIKLRHTKLINITTPTGLYEKLIHIAYEPSYEDTSTDEDQDGNNSNFPNWQPHRVGLEDERVDLTTEGPTTKRQNKRHKIFLTNNQIRGTYGADDNIEDGNT